VFEAPLASTSKQQNEAGHTSADSKRIEAVEAQMAEMHACMRQILAATQANAAASTSAAQAQPSAYTSHPSFAPPWSMSAQPPAGAQHYAPTHVSDQPLQPVVAPLYLSDTSDQFGSGASIVQGASQQRHPHFSHDLGSVRSSPPSMTQFSQGEPSATPMSMTTHSFGQSPVPANSKTAIDRGRLEGEAVQDSARIVSPSVAAIVPVSSATQKSGPHSRKRLRLDDEELPDEGLGAPIEALRGLAEAAVRRGAVKPSGSRADERTSASNVRRWISGGDESPMRGHSNVASRFNSPGPDEEESCAACDDLVSKGALDEREARRLWATFSRGCPRFVAACFVEGDEDAPQSAIDAASPSEVHDKERHAFNATRKSSPFLFATILAIGAQVDFVVHNDLYDVCLNEAQTFAQQTLVKRASQLRVEDVMALNLLASYCDYGWLLCGQAIRVAQELRLQDSLHRLRTLATLNPTFFTTNPRPGAASGLDADVSDVKAEARRLAHCTRVWFFTFLLEHQISYGAGRHAVLPRDCVRDCRQLLQLTRHFDRQYDARFVATVELMTLREKHFDCLAPYDQSLNEAMMAKVHSLNEDLHAWLDFWQDDLRKSGHEENSFLMASLHLQCATAKLYLTSTCLRSESTEARRQSGSESPTAARWEAASTIKRTLIMQSIRAALEALRVGVSSEEYLRLLTWAPHYTVVTMTFAVVYVLKAVRLYSANKLFSSRKHQQNFFDNAQALAMRLCAIAKAHRYGAVLFKLLLQCPEFTQSSAMKKGGKEIGNTMPRTPRPNAGSSITNSGSRLIRTSQAHTFGGADERDGGYAERYDNVLNDPLAAVDLSITDSGRMVDYPLDMNMFLPTDASLYDTSSFPTVNFSQIADERFGSFDQLLRDLGLENGMSESSHSMNT
jgi:hypothetical protein